MSITNNKDTSRTQTFTYDSLNRITSGWSTAGAGALSWGENYAVDPWGNLMTSPMSGKAHGGNFQCAGDPQNHATCLSYDAAGNVTVNSPASYVYDQENRIASTAGMTYAYDANGNRVEKTGGGGTLYWYGSPGIVAETDLTGALKSEYVFFNGKRVARIDSPGNTVHYYLSDHLSSTSMVVSSTGITEEESDYSPFGTEYLVMSSGANHYKFTGKERDTESHLDYFGARYYSNGLGRFISADWSAVPVPLPYATLDDPQTLNLYTYVRNIPTTRFDPNGHKDDDCGWWCRVKQRFSNANQGLGFRTNAEVKQTAQHMRDVASGSDYFAYRDPKTGKINVLTADQLSNMSDGDAVALWDTVFPGQDGDKPAEGVAIGFFTTTFGSLGFEKPVATDKGLENIIGKLYQDTDTVAGGTAGAARYEAATGNLLSPKGHWQDCADTAREISNYLADHPGLSSYDQSLAKALIEDLTSAAATKR